jgi:hypothetical protein
MHVSHDHDAHCVRHTAVLIRKKNLVHIRREGLQAHDFSCPERHAESVDILRTAYMARSTKNLINQTRLEWPPEM